MPQHDLETRDRIRALNDRLRTTGAGGRVAMTPGVLALGPSVVLDVLAELAAFDAFNADNDPYGEHDCAVLQIGGERFLWKIDYYEPSLASLSTDPADPAVTERVLTIMLSSEY